MMVASYIRQNHARLPDQFMPLSIILVKVHMGKLHFFLPQDMEKRYQSLQRRQKFAGPGKPVVGC